MDGGLTFSVQLDREALCQAAERPHRPTQEELILWHLQRFGEITPLEALDQYGCMRLGARIWELKRRGHDIDVTIEHKNGKSYARYTMRRVS